MRMDESRNVEDARGSGFRLVHGICFGSLVVALFVGWIFHINPLASLRIRKLGTRCRQRREVAPHCGLANPHGAIC